MEQCVSSLVSFALSFGAVGGVVPCSRLLLASNPRPLTLPFSPNKHNHRQTATPSTPGPPCPWTASVMPAARS
jgi:hypothetical protein